MLSLIIASPRKYPSGLRLSAFQHRQPIRLPASPSSHHITSDPARPFAQNPRTLPIIMGSSRNCASPICTAVIRRRGGSERSRAGANCAGSISNRTLVPDRSQETTSAKAGPEKAGPERVAQRQAGIIFIRPRSCGGPQGRLTVLYRFQCGHCGPAQVHMLCLQFQALAVRFVPPSE